MAQWIRPQTLNHEVPGSNLLAAAVVPLGKALYPHCLVPRKGLKAIGPLVACLKHRDSFGKSENLSKIFFAEMLVFGHDYEGKSSSSNGLL